MAVDKLNAERAAGANVKEEPNAPLPPPPPGVEEKNWQKVIAEPPTPLGNAAPMSHAEWAEGLKILLAHANDPAVRKQFDMVYARGSNRRSADLLAALGNGGLATEAAPVITNAVQSATETAPVMTNAAQPAAVAPDLRTNIERQRAVQEENARIAAETLRTAPERRRAEVEENARQVAASKQQFQERRAGARAARVERERQEQLDAFNAQEQELLAARSGRFAGPEIEQQLAHVRAERAKLFE